MTSRILHTLRGRGRAVLAALVVAGAAVRIGPWPLYREWTARLDEAVQQEAEQLRATQRLVLRTRAVADSVPAWQERLRALQKSRVTSLDAIQREGIRGLRLLADSAGVTTEAIVADRYGPRAVEACRQAVCERVITLRATFIGDTESALELIAFLDDSVKPFRVRELLLQPQNSGAPTGSSAPLRIEATVAVAGLLTSRPTK